MNILTTENLVKKYKRKTAVDNVNMHIDKGDIYGFVGENGAGKTTVIRVITGLAAPTSGNYSLFGVDYDDSEIYKMRKKTGAIVEAVTLNGAMNAMENLHVQCLLTDVTRTDEELIDLIKLVGLDYEEIKTKKVKNFSLGMRQRMGLAMVMVSSPEFIVLDEPLNGLDPQGFVDVREAILSLAKERGVTFLISSHVLAELDKICNKVGFISHGKLLEEISIDDLHKKTSEHLEIKFKDNENATKFINILKQDSLANDITIDNNIVIIYGESNNNELIKMIYQNNLEIQTINTTKETIEDYYLSVIRKEK